mgnify:CR=1 FL=1
MRSWTKLRTLDGKLDKAGCGNDPQKLEWRTFSIAVLPAATAAATERNPRIRGAFQGAIPRMTPRGSTKTSACV